MAEVKATYKVSVTIQMLVSVATEREGLLKQALTVTAEEETNQQCDTLKATLLDCALTDIDNIGINEFKDLAYVSIIEKVVS